MLVAKYLILALVKRSVMERAIYYFDLFLKKKEEASNKLCFQVEAMPWETEKIQEG